MISLKKLNVSDKKEISFVEKTYTDSFPYSERRPFDKMIGMYNEGEIFNILLIVKENKYIGFLTYMEFAEFIFAEHFAITAEARNGGVGAKVMTLFVAQQSKPIILEVELPTTILSERRIGFYQRLGFKLWTRFSYQQPAYHADSNIVPMYLMTYGSLDLDEKFRTVKEQIYSAAYEC